MKNGKLGVASKTPASPSSHRGSVGCCLLALAGLVLAGCTSEVDHLDAAVRQLCSVDGGVKTYETVNLPASKFDEYGRALIPAGNDSTEWGYYIKTTQTNLNGKFEPPTLIRQTAKIVRTADQKIIAVSVVYRRLGGGFLDGYVHGVGYACPPDEGLNFPELVFVKGAP